MQHFRSKITVLLFISLFFGLLPLSKATAQSTSVPRCLLYVYLPVTLNGDSSGNTKQMIQQGTGVQTNHLSDKPDFNGDGCADLAIGVLWESVKPSDDEQGAVQVVYGGSSGLTAAGNQLWHREGGYTGDGDYLGDIQGEPSVWDNFGYALATGDFNQDGYTDLAIGVPRSFIGEHDGAGAVQVLYGSSDGLLAAGNQFWSQEGGWVDENGDGEGSFIGDIYGGAEGSDEFGGALVSSDFNQDGYADLAIGVPEEDLINSSDNAGAVNVLFGSEDGLTWVGNQLWSQDFGVQEENGTNTYTDLGDLIGVAETGDNFGSSMTAGDFDHDGYDDLVIGVDSEAIGSVMFAGAIHILKGSETGLTAMGNQHWHQNAAYLDSNGNGDWDGYIGDPGGGAEDRDWFGTSLAAGDFNGDTFDDLAIGVPGEDVSVNNVQTGTAGVTQVFYGTEDGLDLTDEQWWRQDGESSLGHMYGSPPEIGDYFGETLATGDLNGDGYNDLVIGAPYEDLSGIGANVGSVNVIYGTENGLDLPNHLWFAQDIVIGDDGANLGALVGTSNSDDIFGSALTTSDLNNDGYDDLAIGIPYYTPQESISQSGAVSIMLGTRNGLTVTGNQLWDQDGGWDDQGNYLGDLFETIGDSDWFGWALP